MKKAIIMILLCNLLLSCFAGCVLIDRPIGETQTENPTEAPTEPQEDEYTPTPGPLILYLTTMRGDPCAPRIQQFQYELNLMRFSAQPDNALKAQAFLVSVDPESFFYMCGYYDFADGESTYYNPEECTWVIFETANEIQEYYNGEKIAVAFQINKTKECRNVMPIEEAVPRITYFQEYAPKFLDENNVAAPLWANKTFVVLNEQIKMPSFWFTDSGKGAALSIGKPCVVLDGVCYLVKKLYKEYPSGECDTYAIDAGKYYSAVMQVMITGKYSEIDKDGNTIHYGLFKLEDIVDILLNWEDA